jgi:hypothetical protein
MFAVFGPGTLILTRTDIANGTPVNIGYCQEFSLEESGDTKQLYGQNQYPLAAARGTIKATGKAKAAEVSGLAINAAMHGLSFTAGQIQMVPSEAGVIPTTPFQITVSGSANFDTDLGVIFTATGFPATKVASAPAAGQYSVTAGVYTFNTADTTKAVAITYAKTVTGAGQRKIVTNQIIGQTPTFQLDYATVLNNQNYYLRLYQCICSKFAQTFKLTDFMMPEIDFDIFANVSNQVYMASYADIG